jgi:photosystem II stability/assembly factor-like uncharacterized protein
VDPSDGKRLYAATHTNAVLVSEDGGANWRAFGEQ